MASLTRWTWVWVNSWSWWWTGRPGVAAVHGVAKSQTRLSDWTELIELPYVSTIPLLVIYSEKTITGRDTCTPMFISALFTVSRTRKQSRCPWTDKWIQKLWYIYTVGYYSAIKIYWVGPNEVDEPRAYYTEWSQKEKDKYCILTCAYGI